MILTLLYVQVRAVDKDIRVHYTSILSIFTASVCAGVRFIFTIPSHSEDLSVLLE